ncbi:hypothetical protein B5K03_26910 [Rhizobium phaseoli]|nr:hypothetical protein B5K03_26910 [Rhizobium phaseoli]
MPAVGAESANAEKGWEEAIEATREILAEAILAGQSTDGDRIEITSKMAAYALALIPFASVIPRG